MLDYFFYLKNFIFICDNQLKKKVFKNKIFTRINFACISKYLLFIENGIFNIKYKYENKCFKDISKNIDL